MGINLRSPLFIVLLTIVIDRLGESLIFPILPFLVERFNFDALSLTLLFSAFAAAQFIAAPLLGALSDHWGRRPVLLICIAGTALSYILFAVATVPWLLFVSRIIDGLTGGVVSTAQAYIADTSAPADRAKNFGLTGAAFGIGFIFGPAIGGSLAAIDLKLPIWFAAVLALVNVVLAYFILPESLPAAQRSPLTLKSFALQQQWLELFNQRTLQALLMAFFIFNFAFAGFTSIFVLFLKRQLSWGPAQAGIIFVIIGVVSTIVQAGLIRSLIPRFGEQRLSLGGLLLVALALLGIAAVPSGGSFSVPLLYSCVVGLAFGVGIMLPSLRGVISNRVRDQDQGKIIGASQSLQSVAGIAGPAWAGWVFDRWGGVAPAWQSSVMMAIALGFLALGLGKPKDATPSTL
ncbi:MFS transporter [Thermosynechococcus sp. B3]|uniref:MFS transporter n=1 Tax=unclassified Thermosynechococcus TaxID=2622553 RepID=UPI002575E1BC|nr:MULTISPECIES: MFS transporter [unclassified Thermosynechococcus]WJI28148.1 MFS transporter [Thermosynechococcus sp. B3]WKT82706.1 MFS transporter [Thermosynechococcus sp. HY596]WNC61833.1 MFS transporter [Thermosynechococcus sp. HY591]WNC64387.1 MFS transporter [Thermosynechococcus sp. HY593]